MTEREKELEREVERLNRKLKEMQQRYLMRIRELEQRNSQIPEKRKRGRPSLAPAVAARVLALRSQGESMAAIAQKTGISVGAVQKIVKDARIKSRRLYVYMDREQPCTVLDVNYLEKKIVIKNLTEDKISRAFGIRENPDWEDFLMFLESRCMPKERYGLREELLQLGLETYEPELIIEKTNGRVYGDSQWIYIPKKEEYDTFDMLLETKDISRLSRELRERILVYTQRLHYEKQGENR